MTNAQKGAVLALTGSILWGIMGVTSQFLLQGRDVPALWLVNMRMFGGGVILLLIDYFIYRRDFFAVWQEKKSRLQLLIFSFITIMLVQFSYLSAVNYMNAAMATVFVSLAPIMTILWVCLREMHLPKANEALCCIVAVTGAVIMATHGDFTTLSVSEIGLFWGILLPFMGVVYTVQPGYLMKNFRPSNVTGWGLLIGGTVLIPIVQPWEIYWNMDALAIANTFYTVFFGTVMAFWTFLASLRYIKPHIAAIYELVEPASAIILSVLILNVMFELPEMIGTAMIIAPVIYLAARKG